MNALPAAAIAIIAWGMIPTKNARNRGSLTRWLWSAFRSNADSDSERGRSKAGVSSTSGTAGVAAGGGGGTAQALGTAVGGGGRGRAGCGTAGAGGAGAARFSRGGRALPHLWQYANSRLFQTPQYGQGRRFAVGSVGGGGALSRDGPFIAAMGDPRGFEAGTRLRTWLPQYQNCTRPLRSRMRQPEPARERRVPTKRS